MNNLLKAALGASAFAFLLGFTFWPHASVEADQYDAHIKTYNKSKEENK